MTSPISFRRATVYSVSPGCTLYVVYSPTSGSIFAGVAASDATEQADRNAAIAISRFIPEVLFRSRHRNRTFAGTKQFGRKIPRALVPPAMRLLHPTARRP